MGLNCASMKVLSNKVESACSMKILYRGDMSPNPEQDGQMSPAINDSVEPSKQVDTLLNWKQLILVLSHKPFCLKTVQLMLLILSYLFPSCTVLYISLNTHGVKNVQRVQVYRVHICMYTESRNEHGVQDCVRIFTKYKLMMIYDTEWPQP